ncbi:MAG: hypothetical protein ACE5DK_07495, partial [Paracoccaceae bacterium]
ALPADAGGQISFLFVPRNGEETRNVKTALAIYAIAKGWQSGAIVDQHGNLNAAALAQTGHGNFGVIEQHGNGHDARLNQRGRNNSFGIFQFGQHTGGYISQTGNNGAGILFQQGW